MRATGPLQNRVSPDGSIVATRERGLFMGNRGGRLHDPATRTLTARQWASRQWICCVTSFKNRRRRVMGPSYTELFFLDEVTALAAGHRPCFECRRADALAFQQSFAAACKCPSPPKAAEMDLRLHAERLDGRNKRLFCAKLEDLPDGTMVKHEGRPHAVLRGEILPWSFSGYGTARALPGSATIDVLTPAVICSILAEGYKPVWHESAARRPNANKSNQQEY